MSLPAAVLWDMDGTLVDTEPYWIAAEHAIVAEHGGNIGYRCPHGGGTIFTIALQPSKASERPLEISA